MRRPVWTNEDPPPPPLREKTALPGYSRDRLAVALGIVTLICVGIAFFLARDTHFLMPGPLASAHSAIGNCDACHTKSGSDKLSWTNGLVAGDPLADSQACLGCHRMPDTAFYPHGASDEVLEQSTTRLASVAARTRAPLSVGLQSAAFPADDKIARGVYCATCHQEHQGANFNLKKMSSEQCHSCHVVKFGSFDGSHPQFENYPFKRRSRIIYDHAGHFGKHFPEAAQKGTARRVPATCSTCHESGKDKLTMTVAPFERTCTACHLDQIVGKERVSGPKGIPFLTVPGLDLQTLKEKGAAIGEWPDGPEAELTPFMKVMIARNEWGRTLIRTVDRLNLQDLSGASEAEIEAVTNLVWEVKRLFYALISGKASDVLGDLNISCGAKLSAGLVADLTASIPRDVVVRAHQQWLPNLGAEMANRPDTSEREQSCLITTMDGWVTTIRESSFGTAIEAAGSPKLSRPARPAQTDEQTPTGNTLDVSAPKATAPLPEQTAAKADPANAKPDNEVKASAAADERPSNKPADQTDDLLNPTEDELREIARPGAAAVRGFTAQARPDGSRLLLSADEPPRARNAGRQDAEKMAQADVRGPAGANSRAADQTDDLLNPTDEEVRGEAAPGKSVEKAAQPDEPAAKAEAPRVRPERPASADTVAKPEARASAEAPVARATPIISIESDIDPESWAKYGGWYRQDYTIFYRPIGHKDKFIYSWLILSGTQAPKGEKSPAAAVFDSLTSKDAQGSCAKCHSIDDIQNQGRLVNFSPLMVGNKHGRFTKFMHEPHFAILENRGCLTCHNLEKDRPYLLSYEGGNSRSFVSNFGAVKKELCASCHTSSVARQDCLTCHKYHVNGVITPVMSTRIPTE